MNWRDLQPLLLRSAGVVGLAGTIVAVISSVSLSDKPSLRQVQEAAAPQDSNAAQVPAAVRQEPADPQAPVAERQDLGEAPAAPPRLAAAVKLAMTEAATPPDLGDWNSTRVAVELAVSAPAVEPAPAAAVAEPSDTASLKAAETDAPDKASAEAPSLWGDEATNCPRDWVAADDAKPAGGASVDCAATAMALPEPAPLPPVIAAPPVLPAAPVLATSGAAEVVAALPPVAAALGEEPAAENGAADPGEPGLAPATPKPRPDPPPDAVKKAPRVKTAAKGRLPPPPNCGAKHAFWKYVNKKPVWYCR